MSPRDKQVVRVALLLGWTLLGACSKSSSSDGNNLCLDEGLGLGGLERLSGTSNYLVLDKDAKQLLRISAEPASSPTAVKLPAAVEAFALDSGGKAVYALTPGSSTNLLVSDLQSARSHSFDLKVGQAKLLVVTPDGTKAYVAGVGPHIYVVDSKTGNTLTKFSAHADPSGSVEQMKIARDGTRLFVAASAHGNETLSIIDTAADRIVDSIDLGRSTLVSSIAEGRSPSQLFLLVMAEADNLVTVDLSTHQIQRVSVGQLAQRMTSTEDGSLIFVADAVGAPPSIRMVDTASLEVSQLKKFAPGQVPGSMTLSSDGKSLLSLVAENSKFRIERIAIPGGDTVERVAIAQVDSHGSQTSCKH